MILRTDGTPARAWRGVPHLVGHPADFWGNIAVIGGTGIFTEPESRGRLCLP
jgi:hypothetical protein